MAEEESEEKEYRWETGYEKTWYEFYFICWLYIYIHISIYYIYIFNVDGTL